MLFVVGASLALFFEALLLSKKNKALADRILVGWLAVLAGHLLLYYTVYEELDLQYPFLLGLITPFPFMHGPLLFLYTAALTGRLKKWQAILCLHFLPVLIIYGYLGAVFFFRPAAEKIAYVQGLQVGQTDWFIDSLLIGMIALALTYLALTFRLIRQHRQSLKDNFSYDDEQINLNWLLVLLLGLATVWLVVIFVNLFFRGLTSDIVIYATVVLFVVAIGYFGIRQGTIFSIETSTTGSKPDVRYAKSGLRPSHVQLIQKQLTDLMEQRHIYLEEKLSLPKLAAELDIHPNYLSQVINEQFGKNFYDYVNGFRVAAFQKKLTLPEYEHYTFYALALDCGFTSKASFNKAFKKLTGQTPSGYKKSLSELKA